jgi:predicted RND superfamily exporter protein
MHILDETKDSKWAPDAAIMAKHPVKYCGGTCFIMCVIGIIGGANLAIPEAAGGRNQYAFRGHHATERFDSLSFAKKAVTPEEGERPPDQVMPETKEFLNMMYTPTEKDENVLQCKYLEYIYDLEQDIMNFKGFDDVCLKNMDGECFNMTSVTTYLMPDGKCKDDYVEEQLKVLADTSDEFALTNPMQYYTNLAAYVHFDEDFGPDNLKSKMTRSFLTFGVPLKGYKSASDKSAEQIKKIGDWTLKLDDEVLRPAFNDEANSKLSVWYLGGQALLTRITTELLAMDGLWSTGSLTFVLLYVWFYTGSLMISASAMLFVYMCFPGAQFVNKFIFQIAFWDTLCVLVLFLLIGVGCDSCFVFYDNFKHSRKLAADRTEDPTTIMTLRLKYALSHSRKGVGVAAGTSGGAFLSNLASQIMPTAQFGLYAGVALFLEFVFSCTFFVSVLVIYEMYLEDKCRLGGKKETAPSLDAKTGTKKFDLTEYPKVNQFAYNVLSVQVLKARFVLIPIFALIGLAGLYGFFLLEPQKEAPQGLPPDNWLQIMINRMQCTKEADMCFSSFSTEEQNQQLVWVWGLQTSPERTHWKFSDFTAECDNGACGEHVLDEDFNLAKPEIQKWVVEVCERGKDFDLVKEKRIDHCAMQDFKEWLGATNGTFPTPEAAFYDLFVEFLSLPTSVSKYMLSKHIILNDDKKRVDVLTVAWPSVYLQLTMPSTEELHEPFKKWQQFEIDINEDAPDGAKNSFGTTGMADGLWMNYAMSVEFIDSVYRCGAISVGIAVVFMTLATQDVRIVLISMTSIIATVTTTLGTMYLYGWELGIIEAICATLAVGFAVDYTLHLAITYVERGPEKDGLYELGSTREDRVRHSFFELGPAVASGYITTVGAAVFLWMCDSIFFNVFGTFLVTVVTWSVLFAMFFFMPLLSLLGPDHGTVPEKEIVMEQKKVVETKPANGSVSQIEAQRTADEQPEAEI